MKVILLQDVKGLGKKGDLKEVAEGYGRNFLLARKLAEIATEGSVRKVTDIKNKLAEKNKLDLEKTQALADSIEGMSVTILCKEKNGKLFGSVQPKDIANALKKEGVIVPEKSIVIEDHIKEVGEYEVAVKLDHAIETSVAVIIEGA
jgi:large subunit ribosomal protein L9